MITNVRLSVIHIYVTLTLQHFVSERKMDEDIARATRFVYDDDSLKAKIASFAEGKRL